MKGVSDLGRALEALGNSERRVTKLETQLAERTAEVEALREEKLIDDPSREETA